MGLSSTAVSVYHIQKAGNDSENHFLKINDELMFQIFSNRWLCVSPRESWPMTQQIMGVLPRLLLLVGVARGGLLGAGTGEGSCAAPPFREVVNVCLIFYVKNI